MSEIDFNTLFDYNPETGQLLWKVSRGKMLAGSVAGTADAYGYIIVGAAGKRYKAHRIIWEMINGPIPWGAQIDHIDHDKSNNRLENLRVVTNQENHKNSPIQANSKTGYVGVSWHQSAKKWVASIWVRKNIYLGLFDDIKDAIAARKAAEERYGFHGNHGTGA